MLEGEQQQRLLERQAYERQQQSEALARATLVAGSRAWQREDVRDDLRRHLHVAPYDHTPDDGS